MDNSLADEIVPWDPEEIPNQDLLFMRVHRQWLHEDGSISAGAFQNRPTKADGMSTDWEKYSFARATKERAPRPEDNAVVCLPDKQVELPIKQLFIRLSVRIGRILTSLEKKPRRSVYFLVESQNL